jgi:TldD protein
MLASLFTSAATEVREICGAALEAAAAAGATYADVRVMTVRKHTVATRDLKAVETTDAESQGIGVRVLVRGAWGFASSSVVDKTHAVAAAVTAARFAERTAAVTRLPVRLLEVPPRHGRYATMCEIDPLQVSIADKLELCIATEAAMRTSPVVSTSVGVWAQGEEQLFMSLDGADIEQTVVKCGSNMQAVASRDGVVQTRTYPGTHAQGGWEYILSRDLQGNGLRVGEEAVALTRARPCPARNATVVLDAEQVSIQLHESVGHPLELDRIFGAEAGYAGASFLRAPDLGAYRYGSSAMNVVADAVTAGGLGTIGYDHEGVDAPRRRVLIDEGIWRGALDSRETAAELGIGEGGFMRAASWNRMPLIRMANLHLEPGDGSLDDLLADVDDGLYLESNKSWSIDDKRLNFQFGVEVAWEIKRGRRVRMLRDAVYGGMTPSFWAALEAVAGKEEWRLHGIPDCGKGQPGQHVHVSHGTAPARFRDVAVG